jgi:hypothetical protein
MENGYPNLFKCNTGEFYEKLFNHFNFCLDPTILMTALHKRVTLSACKILVYMEEAGKTRC